jgi:hypothetical protein
MKKDLIGDLKKNGGILGYFKHLVKDPVKTVPEVNARLKEVWRFALINLSIIVASLVVSAIVGAITNTSNNIVMKILEIPVGIGSIGIVFALFLVFVYHKISSVLKLRECTNCKEQITYGENVKYGVLRTWIKKETSSKNGHINVRQTEMAQVEISCVCQNCGTPKHFNREFRLAQYNNGNLSYSYVLDDLIKGFFTGEHIQ